MPTLTTAEKNRVKAAIPADSAKIITATVARVYAAPPQQSATWAFTGLEGVIAFVRDYERNTFYLKLVDLNGRGVVWEQEMYEGFVHNVDRTFFHTFEGDECFVGLAFADEAEAAALAKKIGNKQKYGKPTAFLSSVFSCSFLLLTYPSISSQTQSVGRQRLQEAFRPQPWCQPLQRHGWPPGHFGRHARGAREQNGRLVRRCRRLSTLSADEPDRWAQPQRLHSWAGPRRRWKRQLEGAAWQPIDVPHLAHLSHR